MSDNKQDWEKKAKKVLTNFIYDCIATYTSGGNLPDIVKGKLDKPLDFIKSQRQEAYQEGLNLRVAYNDPEMVKQIRQAAVEEVVEKIEKTIIPKGVGVKSCSNCGGKEKDCGECIDANTGFNICRTMIEENLKNAKDTLYRNRN